MATIFTKIINGEIPGTFVYRDELCVAFMSINPIADGHLLVVPHQEVDEWTDLDENTVVHVMKVSHALGRTVKISHQCVRAGLIIAGFEVNHCHIHVIPTVTMDDLDFRNAAKSVTREYLEEHAEKIRHAMSHNGLTPSR